MTKPFKLLPVGGLPLELQPGPELRRAVAADGGEPADRGPPSLCGTTLDQYPKPRPCQAFAPNSPGYVLTCHLDLETCRRVIKWYVARHAAREGPA